MGRTKHILQVSRYRLWFLPALIAAGAAALLAIAALALDARVERDTLMRWSWLFAANADGARGLLQVIATAMIAVAALTFSVAVLILSSGASQYTPRMIRTFMSGRLTQTSLGVFIGVFVYCVIVMRSIQIGGADPVPSIAVTVAVLLSLIGAGFLAFFIHHIASSIQASTIVSSVSADTIDTIDKLFSGDAECQQTSEAIWRLTRSEQCEWHPIGALRSGYLQTVDRDALIEFAKKYLLTIKMEKSVGEFVTRGVPIASITAVPTGKIVRKLNALYSIGHHRTLDQDPGAGVRQLVDIALKAMPPAHNDTATAVMCIDYLSSILIELAPRRITPEPAFVNGELVLIPKGPDFGDFVRDAFEQIREHAAGNVAIYVRLLEALETLACFTKENSRKKDIAEQVRLVSDYARCNVQFPDQLKKIEAHRTQALKHCVLEAAAL